MRKRFHVTYEVVTPESAEHGDVAERGFVDADGTEYEMPPDMFGAAAGEFKARFDLTLRQAFDLIPRGLCMEDSGHWFSEADPGVDCRTGNSHALAFHPPDNITRSSYQRIAALLNLA